MIFVKKQVIGKESSAYLINYLPKKYLKGRKIDPRFLDL